MWPRPPRSIATRFDVVSVYNDLFFQPALGPLLLMAPHLRTAQLWAGRTQSVHGASASRSPGRSRCWIWRHEGRAYLGLARGSWLDQLGIEQRRPLQTLRECVLMVRHLLGRHTYGFRGADFQPAVQRRPCSTTLRCAHRCRSRLARGARGPARPGRRAGRRAQDWRLGQSRDGQLICASSSHAGEAAAGRPTGTVGVCLGAVTVVDDDRARARAAGPPRGGDVRAGRRPARPDPPRRRVAWPDRAACRARRLSRRSPSSSRTASWIAWPSPARRLTWCARSKIWPGRE